MAPSFDWAASSLLCAEEDTSIFYDDDDVDYGVVVEEFETTWHHWKHPTSNQNLSFCHDKQREPLNGLPLLSGECLDLIIKKECEHLPQTHYLERFKNGDLDLASREEAVHWIGKVHAHFSFGALCAYLSINYLDRFLSVYEIPKDNTWMMQLLAVTCLSLAAKMEETEVPLSLDLQVGESKFVFQAITIQRMELLVLSTLKWRMQAITPFSFIDYFIRKINGDQTTWRSSISKSTQLILSTIRGIDFLEFRPSEIAAAVAISVAVETQTVDNEKAISLLTPYVPKDRVVKCVEVMNGLSLLSGGDKGTSVQVPSVPQSPIGVLDAACLSYKSDDTTVGSCANSSHNKRRKLNTPFEVGL